MASWPGARGVRAATRTLPFSEAAPPELQHQVRLHGRLLVDKDRNRRVAFEVRAQRNYLDMQYYCRRRMEIALKRVRTAAKTKQNAKTLCRANRSIVHQLSKFRSVSHGIEVGLRFGMLFGAGIKLNGPL